MLAYFSIVLTRETGRVAAIWPVNALMLAAMLGARPRAWPGLATAGLVGCVVANIAAGDDILTASAIGAINPLEALGAAWACLRFAGSPVDLRAPRQLAALSLACIAASLCSAGLAAAVLSLTAATAAGPTLWRWFAADALGLLVVTPALLAVRTRPLAALSRELVRPRAILVAALALASLGATFLQNELPLRFLLFPALVLCAFQLSAAAAAAILLGVAAISVAGVLAGAGPYAVAPGAFEARIVILQLFLGAASICTLSVSSVVASLKDAAERIRRQEGELRHLLDNSADIVVRIEQGRGVTWVSPSCRRLGYEPESLIGTDPGRLVHPDDDARVRAFLMARLSGQPDPAGYDRTYRLRKADGNYVWVEGNPSTIRDSEGKAALLTTLRDITDRRDMEQRLTESEARYREVTESVTDVILRFGLDARFSYLSPSVEATLGYKPEELLGRPVREVFHPDDYDNAVKLYRAHLESPDPTAPFSFEYRAIHKDGRILWLQAHPRALASPDTGEIVAFQDIARDISREKAAEEALAASEATHRMLAENLSDVMMRVEPGRGVTWISPSCRKLGYEPEDLIGKNATALIHPDDLPDVDALRAARFAGLPDPPGYNRRFRFRKADGDWIWVEGNPNVIRDGGGVAIINLLRDITAQREMELRLAASEAKYRVIAENLTDVIATCDPSGRLTYISPSVERAYGYAPDELLGRSTFDHIHPDDRGRVASQMTRFIRAGKAGNGLRMEYRLRHKAGHDIWIEANPTLLFDPQSGQVTGIQDCSRDITRRKQMEFELSEARDAAEAAAAAKGEFLANMSHEIRTPLTAILGFTSMLSARRDLPPEAEQQIARVSGAGRALLTIVNDVLDFSKIEAGLMTIRPRSVSLAETVAESMALFEPMAAAKALDLRLIADENLPRADVDPDRVRQVLLNLIGNAVKFTDAGGVTLEATYDDAGQRLRVAVCDTGAGMDEAQQAKLFQRFSQVDGSSTRRHGGTGLGLAICRGLVEAMGGEIGVSSSPGRGSTFHFEIAAPRSEAPPDAEATTGGTSLDGVRVLVADDNPVNRELVRALLEACGAEVNDVVDGLEAVEAAMTTPFDVILMDIRMPRLDGPDATLRIRSQPGPNADIPILAFSADYDVARFGEQGGCGFDGLIRKPIDQLELISAVADLTTYGAETDMTRQAAS